MTPQRTRSENPLEQAERIHRRVGLTGPDRLRWAVTFARCPLENLSPGEQLDLLLELRDFLFYPVLPWQRKGGPPKHRQSLPPLRTITEADALEIHNAGVELITTLMTVGWIAVDVSQSVGLYRVERQPGQCAIVSEAMTDNLATVFVHRLLPLLETHGDLLKICPDATCRKPFVASRRNQDYCSVQCASRQATRQYRARQRGQARKGGKTR